MTKINEDFIIRVKDFQPKPLPRPRKKLEITFVELPIFDWVEIC